MATRPGSKELHARTPPGRGRPTTSSAVANGASSGGRPVEMRPRPYQLDLLEAAITDNTIVNLATGAGKTFIAVMLIRELSYEILENFSEPGAKRTIFLVCTVPLVRQQAQYIENHTSLSVGSYVGDMGVDDWTKRRWHDEFNSHHVLVMTHTILKNLLLSGKIHLRQVNLLVFDECHHAVKNHDYVQIMRIFDSCLEHELPRVLGLSASLIPSKCKPGELELKIKGLEAILRCRAEAAKDLEEVAKHATDPDEHICYYGPSSGDIHELKRILEDPVGFLNACKKEQRKTDVYEKVKLYLDDCFHILENLGLWCAHNFACEGLRVLRDDLTEKGDYFDNDWERALMHLGVTHLHMFTQKSAEKLEKTKKLGNALPSTDKVQQLLSHLAKYGRCNTSSPPHASSSAANGEDPFTNLTGIVFVERRTIAAQLTKLLKRKTERDPSLRHLRCSYVVGHNVTKSVTHLRREAHMNTKKQETALSEFRKGKTNLLIATSVLEEGLDVPKCNLVVRFDFPPNFRSYMQSKGRARAKPSIYLVLAEGENRQVIEGELDNYRLLEEELKRLCHDRPVPQEAEILRAMEEKVPPYMPYGKEAGTRATLSSSLSLVYQYCQKLPSDPYTVLAPVFKTESRNALSGDYVILSQLAEVKYEYRSTMTLPMNCPVKEEIVGLWMPTRRIAEKSAALKGVKRLHEKGELDRHLKPVAKDEEDSDDEDEAKVQERKISHAGTEKRGQYYRNEVPQCLNSCHPTTGPGRNYLYYFIIQEADTGQLFQDRSQIGLPNMAFGLLTSKPLPCLKVPKFYLYDHDKELCVSVKKFQPAGVDTIPLTEDELIILRQCHKAIFEDVLEIGGSWLQSDCQGSDKGYLIVPLVLLPPETGLDVYIDMELARRVAEVGSKTELCDQAPQWPCPPDTFVNTLVTGIHRQPAEHQLHEVLRVDPSITPASPFPDQRHETFASYYETKYAFRFQDPNQPALKCKSVTIGESRLKLLTSRFKSTRGEEIEKKKSMYRREIDLFPECCSVYPLPANFWLLARCLPSLLWRLECSLLVNELRSCVAEDTRIGIAEGALEYTTSTTLQGYQDYGFGNLQTQCFSIDRAGGEEAFAVDHTPRYILRGPDNALLLQAVTPKGANDSINLERLETLGDSFLKLATSVYLFCERSQYDHEGKLSGARARRVGNLNLYLLARKRRIPRKIFSREFNPKQMWVPPCFAFHETNPNVDDTDSSDGSVAQPLGPMEGDGIRASELSERTRWYQYHKVTDKGVADCVESLIGAYLVSGGIESCLQFMKWMGIKISKAPVQLSESLSFDEEEGQLHSSGSSCYSTPKAKRRKPAEACPLIIRDSSATFARHFTRPPSALLDPTKHNEVERLLRVSTSTLQPCLVQKQVKWEFSDPSYLLQALTHASYIKNRVTDCYQRLEFLGDAVLDYLVTCHIYQRFPGYGPGEISCMRSALVNNVTFAELAVHLELHKALLHSSPVLFRQIPLYMEALERAKGSTRLNAGERKMEVEDTEAELLTEEPIELASGSGSSDHHEAQGGDRDDNDEEEDEDEGEEMDPPKVLGDVLESIAGAIFLDSGMDLEAVWDVFKHLFEMKIAEFGGKVPIPPVHELYQLEPSVKYKRIPGRREGRVTCVFTLDEKGLQATAAGSSHKAAKAAAAREMLNKLRAHEGD